MRAASQVPYLVLLPGRFTMPRFLRRERWSLKPPFHPYPHLSARAVYSLWHCLSAPPFVVTSRVYLRPDRSYAAPRPMEFGLSSRDCRRERPSALPRRLQGGGWKRVWRVGSFPIDGRPRSGVVSRRFPQSGFRGQNPIGFGQEWLRPSGFCESHYHQATRSIHWPSCAHTPQHLTHSSHEDPQIVGDPRSGLGRVRCHRCVRRPLSARRVQ